MHPDEDSPEDRLVRAAATQLYAGAPAEFVATRTALVKAAKAEGEKDAATRIGALRKPSVAAWVLNQLAHRGDPVIEDLADLGARLRQATSALDAAGIAGLRGSRDAVLTALVQAAARTAADQGQQLTSAVETEVRDTGIAALADEAAEAVLRSGTLTRALSYSGFGEVDLSEASATTSTGVVLTSVRGGRRKGVEVVDEEPDDDDNLDDDDVDVDDLDDDRAGDESAAETVEEDDAEDLEDDGDSEDDDLGADGLDDADADDADSGEEDLDDDEAFDDDEPEDDEADDEPDDDLDDDDDEADDEPEDDTSDAEAAGTQEHERLLEEARAAVDRAAVEIGRRRASVEAARNRTDATRQRVQKLQAQLEAARAEDELALDKLTEAVAAGRRAEADLAAAREALTALEER